MPRAVLPALDGFAAISQEGADHRRAARRAVAWREADLDRVEPLEIAATRVDYRRRQSRYRARAADREHVGGARCRLEPREAGDEIAAVGDVDVVHAVLDAALGDGIVLCLKRPSGVDDEVSAG